jgi:hypothetical protein
MSKFFDWLISLVYAIGVVAFFVGAFYLLGRQVCR